MGSSELKASKFLTDSSQLRPQLDASVDFLKTATVPAYYELTCIRSRGDLQSRCLGLLHQQLHLR